MSAKSIDPQLNQTEETWGILWDEDYGFCTYNKGEKDDPLRFIPQGTTLNLLEDEVDGKSKIGMKVKMHEIPVMWKGIEIQYHALKVVVDDENTGPVYHYINYHFKKLFNKKTVDQIQEDLSAVLTEDGKKDNSKIFNSKF